MTAKEIARRAGGNVTVRDAQIALHIGRIFTFKLFAPDIMAAAAVLRAYRIECAMDDKAKRSRLNSFRTVRGTPL